MEECNIFTKGSRKYQICTGQADLPIEKINGYRSSWQLEKLTEINPIQKTKTFHQIDGMLKKFCL
jgi:hypothetical protein